MTQPMVTITRDEHAKLLFESCQHILDQARNNTFEEIVDRFKIRYRAIVDGRPYDPPLREMRLVDQLQRDMIELGEMSGIDKRLMRVALLRSTGAVLMEV